MCIYVSDGAMCRGSLYICEYYAFISLTIFRICFYFIHLNIILIYPHISSDTSTYWSLRHLQTRGCLIKSISMIWLSLSCLPPTSPTFFRELHGWQWRWHQILSFIYNHFLPFLYHWMTFPKLSLQDHLWSLFTERKCEQVDKAEDKRKEEMWVLHFWMGSDLLHSPSNSMWIYFRNLREELKTLVFLKEGNEPLPDWKSEATLKITR